jgi:hypothetical protein
VAGRAYVGAIESVAAVRQLPRPVSAWDQASGGARARKIRAAMPSWSGVLDCVMLNRRLADLCAGGPFGTSKTAAGAIGRHSGAGILPRTVDTNGQAEGGARAWKI